MVPAAASARPRLHPEERALFRGALRRFDEARRRFLALHAEADRLGDVPAADAILEGEAVARAAQDQQCAWGLVMDAMTTHRLRAVTFEGRLYLADDGERDCPSEFGVPGNPYCDLDAP